MKSQIHKLRREVNIMIVVCTILIVALAGSTTSFYKASKLLEVPLHSPVIVFDDLSPTEKAEAQAMIEAVKPEYLNTANSITFTSNLSKFAPTYLLNETVKVDLNYRPGFNYKRNIYINIRASSSDMRKGLCHELNHNFVSRDPAVHDLVEDIATYLTCFGDGVR